MKTLQTVYLLIGQFVLRIQVLALEEKATSTGLKLFVPACILERF